MAPFLVINGFIHGLLTMEVSSAIIPYGLLDEARIAQIMEVCLVTQQSVRQKAVDL